MHLSTHNWMRAEPLETTLERIKKFGYESIEISGEPTQYETKETRGLLKEHGIRCWGAVTLTLGERNLAAKDEGQRARSVDYMKSVITMVTELEGEIITLVPATVGKVVPDGTERGGMEVGGRRHQGMLRARARRRASASPSSRSTVSRPISSTAPTRHWRWPKRSVPIAASASMPSTSISRKRTCMTRSGRPESGCSISTSPTTTAWRPAWASSTGRRSSGR